jgi:DNA-binding protein Fis
LCILRAKYLNNIEMKPKLIQNTKKLKKLTTQLPLRRYVKSLMKAYYKKTPQNKTEQVNIYDHMIIEAEHALLEATIEFYNNNKRISAKILGMAPWTLHTKLVYYDIYVLLLRKDHPKDD